MSATAFLRELRGAGDRKAFAKEHVDTLAFFLQRPIAEFVPRHPNTLPKRRDLDHALLQNELRLPSEDDVYHVFHCYQAHKLLKRYQTTVASAAECGADSVAAVDLYDAAVQTKIPTTEVVQELRFFLHAERVAVFRVFAVLMRCKEPGCLSEAMIRKLVNNAHASYLAMNQLDPDCCEMLQTALETQIACLETLVAVADAVTTSSPEVATAANGGTSTLNKGLLYAVYGFPTLADLCRQFSAESFLGCLHFLRPKITGTFFRTHPDAGAVLRANQALYFRLAQHVADLGVVLLLLLMQRTVRDGPENPKIAPDEVAHVHSEIGSWASEFADRVPHNPAVNNEDFGFLFPPSSDNNTLSQNEQSEEEESCVKAFEQQHVLKQTAVLCMQWLVVASDRERTERGEKKLNLGKALGRSRAAQVSPRLLPFALQEIVGRGRIFGGGSWGGQSCAASSSVLSPFDGKVPVARVLAHLGFEDDELSGLGSTCREVGFFRSHFCAHKTVLVDFCSSVSECVELRDCAMLLPNALSFVVANAFAAPGGLQRRKQEIWSVDIQERKGLQPLLAHMVNDLGTYLPSLLNILANILTNDAGHSQVYDTLMQLLLHTRVNSFTTLLPSVADCVSMAADECGILQQDVYLEHFFLRQFGVGCSPVYDACCARFAAGAVGRLVRKAVVVGGNGELTAAVGVHWVVGEGGGFAILPLVLLAVDGFLDCHAHAVLRASGSNLVGGTGIGGFARGGAAGGLSAPLETALPAAAITFLCKLVAAFPEKFRDAEPELPLSADGLREARKRSAMRGGMSDATVALCSFGGVGRDENLADDKIRVPLIPRLFKLFLCCAGHAKYRFLVPTVLEALAAYFKAGGADDDEPEANSYDELLATSENEDEKIIDAERQQKQGHEKLPPGGTTANGGSFYGEADNLYNRRHPRDLAAGAGSRPFRAAAAQVPSGPPRSNGASPHQRPQPGGPVQHPLKIASNDRARAFSLLLLVEEYQTAFFACLHAILEAEKAEGGCYSNLLSVLEFFQTVLDAVPAASWGRNWHKLAQTGHLSAGGNTNNTSGSATQPAIESLAQIRESQFGLLEDWLQFVLASVFAKHQSGWAYARSPRSVSQQIGAACVRIARLAFTSLFGSCRSLLALADQTSPDQITGSNEVEQRFDIRSKNNALGTRRDAETMRDLTANLRKRQYRLVQLFSENAVIVQILETVTCEMVVFQQAEETGSTETGNNSAVMSSAVSSTTPKSSKVLGFLNRVPGTESGRLRGCGFGAGRAGSRIAARGHRGEKEGEQLSGEGESLVERTEDHELLQRLLLGATWAPNQVPGAADPFRVVDYAHFYERDADEALLLEALELLNAVLVACCTDGRASGFSPLTQLRDHLLAQTSTPTCARQQSLTLLQTGTPAASAGTGSKGSTDGATASAEIFSLDLVKSLFHLATRSRATDDHQSVAVSVLAAQALKQQCLLWEVPETRRVLGKDLYLSEFLSVNCAPVAVATSGPSSNQADRLALAVVKPPAEKEDPKNAKDENRENTMKSTSKSSSTRRHHDVHLGHLFVSRLLRVREPDLREALLALACVGVRFQSSVFLALDRQPLIQRCLQLVQECAQAFPGDDESHKVKGDKENNNKTVSRPLRRWIARYSSLLWHGVHLLGEVVNTLFVDFADLTQVWLLLVAVHEKLAKAVREIVPDFFLPENYSTKNGRGGKATATTAAASRQYYFYLVNSVKEIYFLAYVGIAKQANCLEAMNDRNDFSSGSFGSLRLLLATCLTDEYELWLQDETTTNLSMFVPPKTLEATRERLRARCHKAGMSPEDLYVELMAAGSCRNAAGRSSSSADAGSSGSTQGKNFSGEEQTTEANTVLIHAHAEENYQRLMRQEVADDLIRSVGAGAAQIAGATNPTSYQPDAVTDALYLNPHGQRVVQSARYGYLANRSGNVASVAAAPSLRAARTLSDVSVVRAEAMRASSMIFDKFERARCLKKHFLSSGGSSTTTLPNLADALELLANYTDGTGRQHRFEDGSAFEELSQVVTLQHECVGMFSQLVLATAELSAHVANKFQQTTLANDLISPILPRLIPYLSQVLADQFGITGVVGGTSTPIGGARAATSMVPSVAMLVTVVNRLLQFPLYFSPGMQFPVFGKWFSGVNANNPPRLPDAMLAVLGITNEPTKQGAQLSLQLAGFLSWSVRKIVADCARDDVGGQRYNWGRDDARPQQLLDGIVAVAGLLAQLLPALVGVEDDDDASSNTSGEREDPSRAEVEEIGVAVLRAVTELLHFHQQHGPPALGVFGSAPVPAFSEDPKYYYPARKRTKYVSCDARSESFGSGGEALPEAGDAGGDPDMVVDRPATRTRAGQRPTVWRPYHAPSGSFGPRSSYQSWFYREAAASRKTGTPPETAREATEISACFLNAGFGALLLSLVERVANILPVEEYTDAYSSFLSVLTQASRNGMWRLQPGARSSEVARLLGGGGNNLKSSHDTSNIKSQFLYGSTGATTVGSVTQKSLQQVTAARIDACVSLFATLGGGSITGATLLLEYGILEHAASNVGLQAFYGNGVVETSAYADEARKPLHCSWTQLLALVAQLLATAGPSSSFDQFLNGYEERFLYLLEERDMITELAMLEEVVMMSKILAHLPIHDARTTYLLCMALQTQHFLASVLLSENEVTSSDVIRPLTVTERIAGRAGQIHTFLPAEVPSIFHQRAQYLCYEMSRHLLSALLKLIGQEPGLLSQEYFEVDYAGAATAGATAGTSQLAIGYQLGDGGQFGQRTLADGVLFQPGHQRGAPVKESIYFGGLAGTQPYVAERRMYTKRVHWSVVFEQLVDSARRASHFLGSLEEVLGTLAGGGENANPQHPEMHNLARPRIPAALLLADRARSNRESEDAFLNRGGSKFGMDKRRNFGGPADLGGSWGAEEVMPTSGSAVQMPALEPDVLTDFLDEVEEVARRKREAALSPVVIDMEEVIDGPQARATGEPSYQGDNKKTRGNIAGPRKRFRPTGLAASKKSLSAAQRLLLSAAGGSAASTGELEGKMKHPVPKLTTSNLGELGAPGLGVERERPGGESSVCVPLALYLVRNPYAEDGAEVSSGTGAGGGGARHNSMSRPSVGAPMSPRIEVTRKDHSRVGGMCALPVGTQPLGVVPEAVTVAEYHSLCLTCLELAITCVYQYCCAPGLNNENVLYAILNLLHQMTQDPGFLSAHESTKELLLLIEDSLRQRSVLRDL